MKIGHFHFRKRALFPPVSPPPPGSTASVPCTRYAEDNLGRFSGGAILIASAFNFEIVGSIPVSGSWKVVGLRRVLLFSPTGNVTRMGWV